MVTLPTRGLTWQGSGAKGVGVVFPGLSQIEAYWEALRGDARAPTRQRIDPRGLEGALGVTFLAEALDDPHHPNRPRLLRPTVVRLRLAGQMIRDAMGMEVRGMMLSALVQPAERPVLTALIDRVLGEGARITVHLVAPRAGVRPPVAARLLMLPVTDRDGRMTRILGGLSAPGLPVASDASGGPRRFLITGHDTRPPADLAEVGARAALTGAPAPRREPAMGMAEPTGSFTPAPRLRPTRAPHLKLVDPAPADSPPRPRS